MSTLIDYDACVARLTAANPGGFFKVIETAFDIEPLESTQEMPAVFMYPGFVDADPMGDGSTFQRVNNTLVVDLICVIEDLRTAVGYLRDCFIGWEMDNETAPFALAAKGYMQNQACGPLDLRGGIVHWQERYLNSTHTKRIHN